VMACIFSPAAMAVGSVQVSAVGKDKSKESTARYHALENLRTACRKKGMVLYEGKFRKDAVRYTYDALKYSGLGCTNCTIKISGRCLPQHVEHIDIACSKGKRVRGSAVRLPGGGLHILIDDGSVVNVRADSLDAGGKKPDTTVAHLMCKGEEDPSYIGKMKAYLVYIVKRRENYCENLRKKGKDIPKECSQGKSVSFGVAGGVRQ